MPAGTGAQERATTLARRLEDKRAALAALELEIEGLERQLHAWSAGAEGERLVAAELARLEVAGWCLLHDVHWPGRPRANLDHVAIGPAGVFVVDAKNWTATAQVRDGVLSCGGHRRAKEAEGVAEMVAAVSTLVAPRHRSSVRGVIAVVQQDLAPSELTGGTVVLGRGQLVDWLLAQPARVDAAGIAHLAGTLRDRLGVVTPRLLTSASVLTAGGLPERQLRSRRAPRAATAPPRRPQQPVRRRSGGPSVVRLVVGVVVVLFALTALRALGTPAAPTAPTTGVSVPAPAVSHQPVGAGGASPP